MGEIYEYIIGTSITEVVIKMRFAKMLFLLFLVNHDKLLAVLA